MMTLKEKEKEKDGDDKPHLPLTNSVNPFTEASENLQISICDLAWS